MSNQSSESAKTGSYFIFARKVKIVFWVVLAICFCWRLLAASPAEAAIIACNYCDPSCCTGDCTGCPEAYWYTGCVGGANDGQKCLDNIICEPYGYCETTESCHTSVEVCDTFDCEGNNCVSTDCPGYKNVSCIGDCTCTALCIPGAWENLGCGTSGGCACASTAMCQVRDMGPCPDEFRCVADYPSCLPTPTPVPATPTPSPTPTPDCDVNLIPSNPADVGFNESSSSEAVIVSGSIPSGYAVNRVDFLSTDEAVCWMQEGSVSAPYSDDSYADTAQCDSIADSITISAQVYLEYASNGQPVPGGSFCSDSSPLTVAAPTPTRTPTPSSTPAPLPQCTLSLDPGSATTTEEGTQIYTASVNMTTGSSSDIQRVDFTNSNGSVASINPTKDNNGADGYSTTATALSYGSTIIDATAQLSGGNICTDSSTFNVDMDCTVNVLPGSDSVEAGNTRSVEAQVSLDTGSSVDRVEFSSSDAGIAAVTTADNSSPYYTTATGVSEGSATITATVYLNDGNTCSNTATLIATETPGSFPSLTGWLSSIGTMA